MSTLSFHKVMFSAEEVLDLVEDIKAEHESCDPGGYCAAFEVFEERFLQRAEDRSRGCTS